MSTPWWAQLAAGGDVQRRAAHVQNAYAEQLTQTHGAFLRAAALLGAPFGGALPAGASLDTGTAAQPGSAPLEAPTPGLSRVGVALRRTAPTGVAMPGLLRARVVHVIDDGSGVGAALVTGLEGRGIQACLCDSLADDATAAIFLRGLAARDGVDAALDLNREAFCTARSVARASSGQGGLFVTVQDLGGDFALSGTLPDGAWSAGLAGLVRTAALEWSDSDLKAIDVQRGNRSPGEIAAALLAELLAGGPELEVGLAADGSRYALETVDAPRVARALASTGARQTFVVTGGARGITAESLMALAVAEKPRFLLLGRTSLFEEPEATRDATEEVQLRRRLFELTQAAGEQPRPNEVSAEAARILANREVQSNIERLTATGAEVRYAAVDVTQADALQRVLAEARAVWGPITGLIHAAGVIADRRIADKTDEQFERVFRTKVVGLHQLLTATREDPLQFLVFYSSIAARTGNLGQCDYAMANEILNRVAAAEAHRRGPACVVRSLGWGPWHGGMVSDTLARHFLEAGIALIELAAGAQALLDELRSAGGPSEVLLVEGDPALFTSMAHASLLEKRAAGSA